SIQNHLFIHKSIELTMDHFIVKGRISIFKKIDKLINEDIFIGGKKETAIPKNKFETILKKIPNDYQIKLYVESLITPILQEYLETTVDSEQKYQNYMNKKPSKKGEDLTKTFKEYEIKKYEVLLEKLNNMLDDDVPYSEKQWQKEIIQILLLLYPKYIRIFENVGVQDSIKKTVRKLDYMLVDSNGTIDIVEIKKPCLNTKVNGVIRSKPSYRDNYIPLSDLSGAIMQIEKYIFHLTRWANKGEKKLTAKYKSKLPPKFKIKITNPSGIVIMGRDINLDEIQKQDFEIIKRKYKNIIDIITYDELLRRLEFMISSLKLLNTK
ncbi:Shedu immune nuclease family protein, partial [Nanoarchaeota archaeon]